MKRVLLLSYYFSDLSIIGAVRVNALAKYLPRFGWEPIVLTANSNTGPNSNLRIVDAPCEQSYTRWKRRLGLKAEKGLKEHINIKTQKNNDDLIDTILKIWDEIFNYPDSVSSWRRPAVKLGKELLLEEHFDAIISSSAPPICHLIAEVLKESYGLPWIADFRDLWTQNHYYNHSRIRYFFERQLELRTMSNADALVTVSDPLAMDLKSLHNGKETYVIPNGFDPAQLNPGKPLTKKFTITYTGALYKGRRDPAPLFKVITDLVSSHLINPEDLSVEFYGIIEDWLLEDVSRYGIDKIVKICGPVSREESIERQRSSHLLLLLTWNNPKEHGVYTGKLFDYLSAKRPILSIGLPGGVVEKLLMETRAGIHTHNQEELKRYLLKTYHEYKTANNVIYQGIPSKIENYSHIEMARKFSEILNKVASDKN